MSAISGLVINGLLLLGLAVVYDAVGLHDARRTPARELVAGLFIGLIGVAVMVVPWRATEGVFFDTRSVLLSLSGLFLGTWPTIIAAGVVSAARLTLGGGGATMGVAVTVVSAALGLLYRRRLHDSPTEVGWGRLYGFGLVVHLAMLACTVFLPLSVRSDVARVIAGPVMIIYPLVTIALGHLLRGQLARRAAVKALRAERERLRLITDTAPVGITRVDRDGQIVYASPFAGRLLGLAPEAVTARRFNDVQWRITRPDGSPMPDDELPFALVRASGQPVFNVRHDVAWPDGRRLKLSINAAPVRDAEGRFDGIIAVIDDVTERLATAAALAENEERLRLALSAARQGLYDLDLTTGEAVVTDEYALMLGYDPATFRETNAAWRDRLHPDDREPVYRVFEEYVAGQRAEYRVEFRQRTATGGWVWILSLGRIVARDETGRPTRMLGTHTDITDRKAAEEQYRAVQAQLLQAQKMDAVGRLAGGVAHDFNNMLSVILGYTEAALETIPADDPLAEDLGQIRAAAERSADLTRQLLAFSRQQRAHPRPVDLNDVIADAHRLLDRLLGETVTIDLRPSPGLWTVRADPAQLHQVLANLAINARDALSGGGTITVATANVTILEEAAEGPRPGEWVVLTVADTGCGMDEATLAKACEPFFTTKPRGQGTGLGLATVYGIVEQSGGLLQLDSQPGAGTTVRVWLPRHHASAEPAATAERAEEAGGCETILVVEDEAQLLRWLERTLTNAGYQVLATTSPEQALVLAEAFDGEIELLVSDVVMPQFSGPELFERLLRDRPALRPLFISGYSPSEAWHASPTARAARFLPKPFTTADLLREVRRVLDE